MHCCFILYSAWVASGKEESGSDTHGEWGSVEQGESLLLPGGSVCVPAALECLPRRALPRSRVAQAGWSSWAWCWVSLGLAVAQGPLRVLPLRVTLGPLDTTSRLCCQREMFLFTEAFWKGQRTGGEQGQAPWSAPRMPGATGRDSSPGSFWDIYY